MKILHVDTGKEWRGGQRQALLLHEGLLENSVESYLAGNESGKLIKKCKKNCIPYRYKGEINPVSIFNLKKIIDHVKPDIVHSHDAHSLTPSLILKYLGFKYKLVHTRRVDFHIKNGLMSRWKYNNKNTDSLVAISEAVKNILISDGIKRPVEKIYSGLDMSSVVKLSDNKKNDLRKKLGINPGDFIIGSVGNFVPHKDFATLIRAFRLVYDEKKNVKLLLVGEGELLNEMRKLAEDLNISDKIIFTGYAENVDELMNIMDLYAATSQEEGLNTSVIEAMMHGLPVVATKAGGLPELVKDDYNGYLCDIKDYTGVADKLTILLNDEEKTHRFSLNSFEISEKFEEAHVVEKYRNLYQKI
ncbi:glycosyl transferase group 1 [Flexistipes sinusarabici DSM 4947]|uniref:Glycosyl transferase group 1 n=1 Tax=Flexistipes sinusarabici (strain ATCC 49648 / DSM 4947 / MAS 10) TaxID=717231 RepID=F8E819_FLESM|nr:glycosyltransferase family 4 protein [Flexistipes sinusarabici]AEI13943.1 glycosyl transferase group 1 [Flexistipes sinusarabici DSM 4947]